MSSDVVVDIRGVTKRYGRTVIFSGVDLQVRRSEVVAIVGPSGAGKSTLIRCVNHLNTFERGSISVLGHEVRGTDEAGHPRPSRRLLQQIRAEVGMVFQTFNLFPHLSVVENITLAPVRVKGMAKGEAEARARQLLDSVGLSHRADAYPRKLSGGEQQRVAICRALAMEPSVMLFDEPTSMLDPELVGEVLQTIQRLAREGMTMMLVTHEMAFARDVADTAVIMADGGIVEKGSARDVLTDPQSERAKSFLQRVLHPTEVPGPGGAAPADAAPGNGAGAVPGNGAGAPVAGRAGPAGAR